MNLKLKILFLFLISIFSSGLLAQKGKDGSETITAAGVIFNRYIPLKSTAAAGSTTIQVGLPSILGAGFIGGAVNNPYTTGALAAGDLLLIIKMQGASMDITNSAAYGNILNYNGVGDYEFVEVGSVAGSLTATITLANGCSLINSYNVSVTERVQVIRVPRLVNLTIDGGGSLTAPQWNGPTVSGNSGGIVALEVSGTTIINGVITVQGKGFMGGKVQVSGGTGSDFASTNNTLGGEKGESIVGAAADYDALGGRYCKGAPANGGGGGTAHNAGGGGGSNGNNGVAYNGLGIPDISVPAYVNAWNVESTNFFSNNSSGGGRGGYTYSSYYLDPFTNPINSNIWGGDWRREQGGHGGKPLDPLNNTRVFLGGGGGAADANNGDSQDAANGGGIIFLMSDGNISGAGEINVMGGDALSTIPLDVDGAPGGGGGGSAMVLTGGSLTGISIIARGGNGGNQNDPGNDETLGPGGGGGGGYILTTATNVTRLVAGGINGVSYAETMEFFRPNGATQGADGQVVNNFAYPGNSAKVDLSVTTTGNSGPFCLNGTKTYTVVVSNASAFNAANNLTVTIPTPAGINFTGSNVSAGTYSAPTWTIAALAAGASQTLTLSSTITASTIASFTATAAAKEAECIITNNVASIVSATATAVPLVISASPTVICAGSTATLTTSGATGYTWSPGSSNNTTIAVTPTAAAVYTVIGKAGTCSITKTLSLGVNANPTVNVSASASVICSGISSTLTASGATSYSWSPGGATTSTLAVTPTVSTGYTLTGKNSNGCTDTGTLSLTVNATPTINITSNPTVICNGQTSTLTAGGATSYTWNPGASTTSSISVSPTSTAVYTLTGKNASGCLNSSTLSLVVNANPTVNITLSPTVICNGQTSTLTASGATSYTWSPGAATATSISVSPASTSVYTLTGENSSNCINTKTISLTVNANPTVTISSGTTVICSGESAVLTATGAVSYTWSAGSATTTTVSVSPTSTTVYSLTGVNSNGCFDTGTLSLAVNQNPTISATASSTLLCSGNNVKLTATGATNYSWIPNPATLTTSSGTSTAIYTFSNSVNPIVTGTIANGCRDAQTYTINVNPLPTLNATVSSASICAGQSATLTATGNAVTYTWNPGLLTGASPAVSPSVSTVYTVTGTDVNGCTNTVTQGLIVNAIPTVAVTSTVTVICEGATATLTAIGATGYTWNPGGLSGSNINVTPASVTIYTVTGENASLCTDTKTISLTVNPNPTVITLSTASAICVGESATLTASGAANYSWSPGSSTGSNIQVSPASTTSYTVTGNNSFGCADTKTVLLTVNPVPTVAILSTVTAICAGETATLVAGGASSYTWYPGNMNGASATVSPASSQVYTVSGENTSGCINTVTVSLTVNTNPTVNVISSPTVICNGETATLTASGAANYTWSPGALTGSFVSVTPAVTTIYTVTGSNVTACNNTQTLSLTVNANPTVNVTSNPTVICNGETTTLTASGAANYTWVPGALTGSSVVVSPTSTAVYTVTGANIPGCVNTQTVSLIVNVTPTINVTSNPTVICNGETATLTANGATSYSWNPGVLTGNSISVTPASTTVYTVTATNSSGCMRTQTISLAVSTTPTVNITATPTIICSGETASLTATGAVTYSWSPGALNGNSISVNPVSTTLYTVTGTNNAGCTNTQTLSLPVNASPTINVISTATAICNGQSATLTASGAAGYTWNPTALNTNSIIVAPASTVIYTVTGANAGACVRTKTLSLIVNANPTITINNPAAICEGATATLTATGAINYTWMPGTLNSSVITVSPVSTIGYTVSGTDINGCPGIRSMTLTVNANPTVNVTSNPTVICEEATATLTAGGATSYTWNPGTLSGGSVAVTPASTTVYTLTGANVSGCTGTQTIGLTVNANPTVNAVSTSTAICNGATATLTASGATSYTWNPGALAANSITVAPTSSTVYTITGANNAGCINIHTISLTVNALPFVNAASSHVAICAGATATLTANGAANYSWNPGILIGSVVSVSPALNTSYTITGTDVNGCVGTQTLSLTVNANPTINATANPAIICEGATATLTASGATSYTWSPGTLTGSAIAVAPANTTVYTVTGVSSSGCSTTETVSLVVNPTPTIATASNPLAICNAGTATLTASGAASYTWYPGTINTASITVTPPATTIYTVNGTNSFGCVTTQTLGLTVIATPTLFVSPSSTLCAGTSASLTAAGATSFTWQPGALSGPVIIVTPTSTTLYTVTAGTGLCSGSETVLVTVNNCPIAVDDETVTIQNIPVTGNCVANDMNVTDGVFSPGQFVSAEGDISINASTGQYTYTPAAGFTGKAAFTYTLCNGSPVVCSSAVINITVFPVVSAQPDSIITVANTTATGKLLINDTGILPGETYSIEIDPLSPFTGTLSVNSPAGDYTFSPHPSFTGTATTTYTIFYNSAASVMSSSATVTILVNPAPDTISVQEEAELFIPQGFSPNNDGVNDVLVIRGISKYPANNFTVLNRWGNVVFKMSGYNNTDKVWNGKSGEGLKLGNEALPAGTYFCILDPGDGSRPYKGYIYLGR